MKRVNNQLLKAEFSKVKNNLIIALICLILGLSCIILATYNLKRVPKDTVYLNDIIEDKDGKYEDQENIKVNLKVSAKPYLFAKYSNETNKSFYFISDGKYYYIAYLTKSEYDKLNVSDITTKNQTIYGVAKPISSDIKKLALNAYNKGLTADKKIADKDFESYFGHVYLDSTSNEGLSAVLGVIALISNICFIAFILTYFIQSKKIKKVFNALSDSELATIEKELDEKDTFHYERAHLILTKNYIIAFGGNILIMKFADIFWIYEYRLRQRGITTQKSLMVMDKEGKTKSILQVDGITKKSSAIISEVAETIASKNNEILVGYTTENQNLASNLIKDIKAQKKL